MNDRREPELTSLSDADLQALAERVDAEVQRRWLERRLGERARGGLIEGQGPRYRNPENPSETWSGRGPQPSWVQALRARGVRLEALRVDDDRPVPTTERSRRDTG